MSKRKIIGVTVGTPTSPAKMEQEINPVKTFQGVENAGKLLYVDESGNVAFLQLGAGFEIVNGRLCIVGTVNPDAPEEPDKPYESIGFTQAEENIVTVSGVVFESQEDGTVLWRGATFTPEEGNTVVIK